MSAHPLDNPVWAALASGHAGFAEGGARARRYPAAVAPFLALADAEADGDDLVAPGEAISLIGAVPAKTGLTIDFAGTLLQMAKVLDAPKPEARGEELDPRADARAMLDLTDVAFPGYFRPRTPEMGRYFGIRDDRGALVAMAGERLTAPGWCEISAVCTHPDHVGKGHARALMARLMALHEAEGRTSYLHVQPANAGAIRLYEALGFAVRAELALWRLRNDGQPPAARD